jgi:molecular chaperone GrpE
MHKVAGKGNKNPNKENGVENEEKVEDYKDLYLRAVADYQNLLKQTLKEKSEFVKYANTGLLEEIIPVFDHLSVALEHAANGSRKGNIEEGLKYVLKQFKDVLKENGVEEIAALGEKFDHNSMDAIETAETKEKGKDGEVARVISKGYALSGKVMRPARVAVYKFIID